MSPPEKHLIGSVFERNVGSPASAPSDHFNPGAKTGFPAVQHRSQSAFARNRESTAKLPSLPDRPSEPPSLASSSVTERSIDSHVPADGWRRQVSIDNERRVASMSAEERAKEKAEIEEQFGGGIGDLLMRVRAAREAREAREQQPVVGLELGAGEAAPKPEAPKPEQIDTVVAGGPSSTPMIRTVNPRSPPPSPSPILSSSTRPSSPARASKKLRFADVTPQDVHVYQSAPPSPRKKALALPAPTEGDSATSLGSWKPASSMARDAEDAGMSTPSSSTTLFPAAQPPVPPLIKGMRSNVPGWETQDAGTPEAIRQRWFPNAPVDDPNLEWMDSLRSSDTTSSNALRFDLKGNPVPTDLSATLPTHLGLHHHAEGSHAGYTLDDIFLLTRSTVPAQRATMLSVLARIARRLGRTKRGSSGNGEAIPELAGSEEELRKRILGASVEGMGEKGNVGAQAVAALWECIVGWDEELAAVDGVELQSEQPSEIPSDENTAGSLKRDAITSLPMGFVLPQIADIFLAAAMPHHSLLQLLDVLHRIAKHTNDLATSIATTPSLIANIFRLFILTSIPPRPDTPEPSPLAIRLLTTIALSSRTATTALLDPADALLRYITVDPSSLPYPVSLWTPLLTCTLDFYTALASYGLYTHIATTASQHIARLSSYILSPECDSRPLLVAYARLLEAWIVCAIDPHQTSPEHDILWSQVVAWSWTHALVELSTKLTNHETDWPVWAAVWNAQAAWLEGSRVNGTKGGEQERLAVIEWLRPGFNRGKEKEIFLGALTGFQQTLDTHAEGIDTYNAYPVLHKLASSTATVSSTIRLWLACFPTTTEEPASEPPFDLPLSLLHTVFATVASHPYPQSIYKTSTSSYVHVFHRPLATAMASYLRLSRRVPTTTDDLWLAQAGVTLIRLMPGDEDTAQSVIESIIIDVLGERFFSTRGWKVPGLIWERGGFRVIAPFLTSLRSREDSCIGAFIPTPRSIQQATTQRLPPAWLVRRRDHGSALPYACDWTTHPLDHLLRSGTSHIWQKLPRDWDANETEVVRATFLLTLAMRTVLRSHGLGSSTIKLSEVVLACMKVFMLEHGQIQGAPGETIATGSEEVFRDSVVSSFMEDLVAPCMLGASLDGLSALPAPVPSAAVVEDGIEVAAERFLGSGTPFYQFYSDFVALYDAISFGHPLFGSLLLPPTSHRYAVDYRKLLYHDTAHALPTVRTPTDRVVGNSVGEYLWPVETDAQVVGAYIGVLVGGRSRAPVDGFVRLVIVHHLAASIWPDLRADEAKADERARKLLTAVLGQGRFEDIRDVATYWQRRDGRVVLPPDSYKLDEARGKERLDWVRKWADERLLERISGLLVPRHF
ncbi:hypothetical protein FA95DRAFT_1675680 [Auriscalpium vulgare]|uniref:Uncharacterized protein n=1 Tax=Auriscalpium vulgare TaxID=40419 RepID=A0ACB8S6W4_9AGAM|nr:hypothetical protein FA95DRAFT_1675680 [Auriscalpium vulgare]